MGRGICAAITVLMLVAPASALADAQIDATPPNRFSASEYTMDQGQKLVFHNGDTVAHDVTATSQGPDNKPLFKSATTDSGKTTTVDGSQYLTEGHYDFICSIHPNMKASLHVTANGTPAVRPGASGPSQKTTTNSSDKTAPAFGVKLVSRRLHAVRQGHVLRVRLSTNEEAHVVLRAIARPRVNGPLVTVAKAETHLLPGTRRVSIPLTAAGRKALVGKRATLAVIVTAKAIDDAGNVTVKRYGRTLRL